MTTEGKNEGRDDPKQAVAVSSSTQGQAVRQARGGMGGCTFPTLLESEMRSDWTKGCGCLDEA